MKHNQSQRCCFAAEWQHDLGGSEDAWLDAYTLMRYSNSHAVAKLRGDSETARKVERFIRHLVYKWKVTPAFSDTITDTSNTVRVMMPNGRWVEVPQASHRARKMKTSNGRTS